MLKSMIGRVKLGTHIETNRRVAIKIVPKEILPTSDEKALTQKDSTKEKRTDRLNQKIEREITIMKLIKNPHVMQLYDVYETGKDL